MLAERHEVEDARTMSYYERCDNTMAGVGRFSRDVVVEGCVRAYIFLRGLHTSRSAVARQYSTYLASLTEEADWHRDIG